MPAMDYVYLILEVISSAIMYLSIRLMYRRFQRTGLNRDRKLFLVSILGTVLYIFATIVQLSEVQLTGAWYHLNNLGIYGFTIIQFGLLVYAFTVVESNEINLKVLVEEKSAELVSQKLKEHEEIDKLRRQHAQELITGARKLSEQIHSGIDKPLKDSLNLLFLMKQNPDLYESYTDSIEEYLEEVTKIVAEIEKKTSVGELKIGFEDVSELVQKAIDATGVPPGITIVYEPQFHALAVDPVKMFLVLENLVENAVEAMGSTGVLGVSIEAENGDLTISISDTGRGIAKDDIPKVFTPFFTRKNDGLGLGLVYCKDVVMAHGGTITFETDNKGTVFIISLPKSTNYVL